MRALLPITLLLWAFTASAATAGEPSKVVLYKNPQCGCCQAYAGVLRANGFKVTVRSTDDLLLIKRRYGVPEPLRACHTMLVEGYVVEGHVPIKTLKRLLAERPDIKGISLPGMPQGSPGMTGRKSGPFTIYTLSKGAPKIYAIE